MEREQEEEKHQIGQRRQHISRENVMSLNNLPDNVIT